MAKRVLRGDGHCFRYWKAFTSFQKVVGLDQLAFDILFVGLSNRTKSLLLQE